MSYSKAARRLGDRLSDFAEDCRLKLDEEELAQLLECAELLERLSEDFEEEEEAEEDSDGFSSSDD